MKCGIHQPQFLPWLGYLHKISSVDVFIFLDNVQFKKNEFQNRNKIAVNGEAKWLTVPVSFHFGDALNGTAAPDFAQAGRKLVQTLEHSYGKTPFFNAYFEGLKPLLLRDWDNLAELNQATVEWLLGCFGITTRLLTASQLPSFSPERTKRLVEMCRHVGADTYFSGVGAKEYLDLSAFEKEGLRVEFQHFEHPVYPQFDKAGSAGFLSHLSAVDGLFHCGGGAEGRARLNLDSVKKETA
ncbi:MAG: WbqC family protein [Lentisphaerota bacterium]